MHLSVCHPIKKETLIGIMDKYTKKLTEGCIPVWEGEEEASAFRIRITGSPDFVRESMDTLVGVLPHRLAVTSGQVRVKIRTDGNHYLSSHTHDTLKSLVKVDDRYPYLLPER